MGADQRGENFFPILPSPAIARPSFRGYFLARPSISFVEEGHRRAAAGDNQGAIQSYSGAIRLNEDLKEAYYRRGVVYHHLGQYQQAIEDFSNAIQMDSNFKDAYYYRGRAYKILYQHTRAIKDFSKVIRLDQSFAEAYYQRGRSYKYLCQRHQAIKNFSQAIQLNTSFKKASYHCELTEKVEENFKKATHYDQPILDTEKPASINLQELLDIWGQWWVQQESRKGKWIGVYYQGDWPTAYDGNRHRLNPASNRVSHEIRREDLQTQVINSYNLSKETVVSPVGSLDNLAVKNVKKTFTKNTQWHRSIEVNLRQSFNYKANFRLTIQGLKDSSDAISIDSNNPSSQTRLSSEITENQKVVCPKNSRSTFQYVVTSVLSETLFEQDMRLFGDVVICCRNKVKNTPAGERHRKWAIPIKKVFEDLKAHPEILTKTQRKHFAFFEITENSLIFKIRGVLRTEYPMDFSAKMLKSESLDDLFMKLFKQGEVKKTDRNYASAIELYTQALKLKPCAEEAYFSRGYCYCRSGNFEKALLDFNKVIELSPRHADAYYRKARIQFDRNSPQLALDSINVSIDIFSKKVKFYMLRGKIYLRLKEFDEAIKDFTTAITYDVHHHSQGYYERAKSYKCQADKMINIEDRKHYYSLVMKDLEECSDSGAIEESDLLRDVRIKLRNIKLEKQALRLCDSNSYQEALKICERIIRADANNGCAHYLKGKILCHLSRDAEAIDSLNKGLKLLPDFNNHVDFFYSRLKIFVRLFKYQELLSDLNRAKTLEPDYKRTPDYLNYLSQAYHGLGRYRECKQICDQAIALNSMAAYATRGLVYEEMAKATSDVVEKRSYYQSAREDFQKNINFYRDQNFVLALNRVEKNIENLDLESRGIREFNAKKYYDARSRFSQILQTDSQNGKIHYWMGRCNYELGQYRSSLESCDRASQLSFDEAYSIRGLVYQSLAANEQGSEKKRCYRQAREDIERYLRVFSKTPRLSMALVEIRQSEKIILDEEIRAARIERERIERERRAEEERINQIRREAAFQIEGYHATFYVKHNYSGHSFYRTYNYSESFVCTKNEDWVMFNAEDIIDEIREKVQDDYSIRSVQDFLKKASDIQSDQEVERRRERERREWEEKYARDQEIERRREQERERERREQEERYAREQAEKQAREDRAKRLADIDASIQHAREWHYSDHNIRELENERYRVEAGGSSRSSACSMM